VTGRLASRDGRGAARRAATALLAAAAVVGAAAACTRRPPRSHAVAIRSFTFQPATLTVALGDTVVWTNEDVVPHTATARSGGWDSGSLSTRQSWRFVAEAPGHHQYFCVFHPNMQGAIEVR
jgi:plastocyanin